ncbi:MAG: hypothetical protein F4X64_19050 [Chloroflexi bacterium]|nr:hypothetical protein [Chloroflexota bacterium]
MTEPEKRVEEILSSPMGCAFFADARERGYLPEDLANPAVSLCLASEAVDMVERWRSDHEEVVAEMLGLAPVIRPLVEATLAQDGTAWWYEPPDPERQVWIAHEGETPDPSEWRQPKSPPSEWERYAQKPDSLQYTSTSYNGYTSLLIAYENHTGDMWAQSWPLQCWRMRTLADVRIYELHGPADWHRLCVAYPAHDSDDGRLVPDWGAASADWDGVHLSLGGLLSCEQNRVESPEGWSKHEFWHTERTFWLRAVDAVCERMPDYHGGEPHPPPSGEPQQTFPPYQPPTEDRPGIMILREYEPGEEPPDLDALLEAERRRIAGLSDGDDGEVSLEVN